MSQTVLAAGAMVSGGEQVIFYILAPLSVLGALGMLLSRNAIHSALWLVLTMLCLGIFYFAQEGPFLGAVQIIVYTGAIMILFLFVLMLVGRDSSDSLVETLRGQRALAAWFGIGFAVVVGVSVYRSTSSTTPVGLTDVNAERGNVQGLAGLIFTDFLFAFELTSALLITAAVGAMVLAHIERTTRVSQKERAIARFASRTPMGLPGPGVYANSDSVATPALLPDGRVAPQSAATGVEMLPSSRGRHIAERAAALGGAPTVSGTRGDSPADRAVSSEGSLGGRESQS